jgi:hypothetical protein
MGLPPAVYYPEVKSILGKEVVRDLKQIKDKVDILDVFRRPQVHSPCVGPPMSCQVVAAALPARHPAPEFYGLRIAEAFPGHAHARWGWRCTSKVGGNFTSYATVLISILRRML